ncbi:MAG: hypothetical protein QM528_05820 [Phycisphaerales bacterium]|nr:hypothetical protein [Phycisphaerales bacterium]
MITVEDIGKSPQRKEFAKQGERSGYRKWAAANISKESEWWRCNNRKGGSQ